MSLNEFAMVEELASLVKDNLPCKHLVLSVEAALLNFLQDDTSSDGVLELEPMDSYKRLLLHRLADIFGFSHESVGEGDARHLVLERCPETSMMMEAHVYRQDFFKHVDVLKQPSILVSDLLWQYDELQTPKFLEVLEKKKKDPPGLNDEIPKSELSLEDREAAYLAARERIFSVDEFGTRELVKPRPPNNPTVARRMIVHALGQKVKPLNNNESRRNSKAYGEQAEHVMIENDEDVDKDAIPVKDLNSIGKIKEMRLGDGESSYTETKLPRDKIDRSNKFSSPGTERNKINVQKDNFREEHMGAAKRMFVNALGFHPRNGNFSRSGQTK